MYAVTGATGQLGRLVIDSLLTKTEPGSIVAIVRTPEKAKDLAAKGIAVRRADYNEAEGWEDALKGVDRLLLVSSSEIGKRAAQHGLVIGAARKAGVKFIAYTSILHADSSPLTLAEEHKLTESLLKDSGVPYAFLRNGWYTENYAASIAPALQRGAMAGSAGDGKISSAARKDYAEAAAAVLTAAEDQAGRIYELAGDESYTLSDFCAELSRQSGRDIPYHDLPEGEYAGLLVKAGLPGALAALLAQSDAAAAKGGLFDDSRTLSRLIGRPTTKLSDVIGAALP